MNISTLETIPRFMLLTERLATSGQPSEQQLADVASAGFQVVINLGLHDDPGYALPDEAAAVRALGMNYAHIPVQFSSPSLSELALFSTKLAAAETKKVFVHCRHNKRVPVFVALDRVLRQGWSQEAAFGEMHKAWLPDANWQAFIDEALARHAGDQVVRGGQAAAGQLRSQVSGMQVRIATPEDASVVAGVLSAAAADLRERGKELWSAAEVSDSAVSPHIRDGLYHLGLDGSEAVGVFRLQLQDPVFWPEIPAGTSAYLHKLAVLPARRGQGFAHELLKCAVGLTREKGLRFLRLDCMGGRPKLKAVYESFGFRHHSQRVLDGQVFERFEFDVASPSA